MLFATQPPLHEYIFFDRDFSEFMPATDWIFALPLEMVLIALDLAMIGRSIVRL